MVIHYKIVKLKRKLLSRIKGQYSDKNQMYLKLNKPYPRRYMLYIKFYLNKVSTEFRTLVYTKPILTQIPSLYVDLKRLQIDLIKTSEQ